MMKIKHEFPYELRFGSADFIACSDKHMLRRGSTDIVCPTWRIQLCCLRYISYTLGNTMNFL